MDETQIRLNALQAAQQRDPDGDVFATAKSYVEWIAGDQTRQQVFNMAHARAKDGQDILEEADKTLAWVSEGAQPKATTDPKKHESVAAVKGQEPRA